MVWDDPARVALMLVTIVVGPWLMLDAFLALEATTWRGRAAEVLTSIREDIRTIRNRSGETDDAPLWAEVLGAIVPFGLLFRAASHVLVAQLHGLDGNLAPTDVSAANAVAAVRDGDEQQADFNGRVGAFLVGLVLWWVFVPGTGPALSVEAGRALAELVRAYVALNILVLFVDPVLGVGVLDRSLNNSSNAHGTQ